jgi:hypothetical protein
MAKQISGKERKELITVAGAKLASKHGAKNVTRRMVAQAAKVSEALVSAHMGCTDEAQAAYMRKAKALKLPLPDKAKAEAIGKKLRAHGPRDARDSRPRSTKEVKAIANKRKPAAKTATRAKPATAKVTPMNAPIPSPTVAKKSPAVAKKSPATPVQVPEVKSAARAPKAPPASAAGTAP